MSEYWKSTPKYWCKHCSIYVRDTGLERKNHESTGKHQGALKRFLRNIHRDHENELREKDRAKREVDRLNGIVGSSSSAASSSSAGGPSSSSAAGPSTSAGRSGPATQEQRHQQWEQLADMGIDVPTELRGDMAMAGGWTVTKTRVIDDANGDQKSKNIDATATGTRKRVKPEGDEEDEVRAEEEKAIQSLFKKPRRWGRDSKQAPEDDLELDALLSGSLAPPPKKEEEGETPKLVRTEGEDSLPTIKKEEEEDSSEQPLPEPSLAEPAFENTPVKKEEDAGDAIASNAPAVVFKKRKPKDNVRQKSSRT